MNQLRLSAALFVLAFAASTSHLDAQDLPRYQATLGLSAGHHALDNIGPGRGIVEGLFTVRTFRSRPVGFVFGAVGGTDINLGSDELNCPIASDGGCQPGFPAFSYAGVLVGGEGRMGPVTLSLMSGPTAFRYSSMQRVGGTATLPGGVINSPMGRTLPGGTVGSIQTRAEAAVYLRQTVGLVLSSTWRRLPTFRGAPYDVNGIGFGIRFQR